MFDWVQRWELVTLEFLDIIIKAIAMLIVNKRYSDLLTTSHSSYSPKIHVEYC